MEWITHRLYLWNIHLICFRLRTLPLVMYQKKESDERAGRYELNMAVGMIWQDEATTELDILLQESEKRMYADKALNAERH